MVLFEKPITLALQKVLICFCTITIFLFKGENVLIIGVKMPIINTFLLIKNIYIVLKFKKICFLGSYSYRLFKMYNNF